MQENRHPSEGGRQAKSHPLQGSMPSFTVHEQFEQYEILEQIGSGGMGVVYKALDSSLKRMVAIKVIQKSGVGEASFHRFQREMEISASLDHPHIVKVYRMGTSNQVPFLAMEYVEGLPILKHFIQEGTPLERRVAMIEKIARALHYAHTHKVVHRDVKPSNIMVRASGEPVLMDFGLAKVTEVSDRSLTRSGEVIGTPQYMAPEQAEGLKRQIEARTDVYALGAVLYHILTGNPPAKGETLMEVIYCVVKNKPIAPRKINPDIPKDVELICLKSLEKEKSKRYASAREMAEDIGHYLAGKKTIAAAFYKKQAITRAALALAALLAFVSLALAAHGFARNFFSPPSSETEVDFYAKVKRQYEKGKNSLDLESSYVEFSVALDTVERHFDPKKKEYSFWKNQLLYALLENYVQRGEKNLQENPDESTIYFSRGLDILEKLSIHSPTQKREWGEKLNALLIRAYFNAGNYQQAYQAGTQHTPSDQNLEILSMIARSAYYCQEEDALTRFEDLAKKSPENSPRYAESLYYQGMIYFYKKDPEKARLFFHKVVFQQKQQEYFFMASLYLYYCATLLINLYEPVDKNYLSQCEFLFSRLDALLEAEKDRKDDLERIRKSDAIYKETVSRYTVATIKAAHAQNPDGQPQRNEELQNKAKTVIQWMSECMMENSQKSDYYYLRGKAYSYLEKYQEAMDDFTQASALDPGKLEYYAEKLDLLCVYADPEEFRNYDQEMLKNLGEIQKISLEPFYLEFARLKLDYARLGLARTRGIPFDVRQFERFYKNLNSDSQEIQRLAEYTLCTMKPYGAVLAAFAEKAKKADEKEKRSIAAIVQKIEKLEEREKVKAVLVLVSRIPTDSKIDPKALEQFVKHIGVLKKIVDDLRGEFCYTNPENWTYMRFLAAKVLANLPDATIRSDLYQNYIESDGADISTRILVAKNLYDVGIVFFDKNFLLNYLSRNPQEYLQALAVQTISPIDRESENALIEALSGTERVRILALYNLIKHGSMELFARIIPLPETGRILQEGHRSKNEHVRALTVLTLWSPELGRHYFFSHPERSKPFLPYLLSSLKDPSPLVQRSAFLPMTYIRDHYYINIHDISPILIDILKQNTSALMRCHTIIALGQLGDVTALIHIGFNPQSPFLEQMASFTGVGWRVKKRDEKELQNMVRAALKFFKDAAGKQASGYLSYTMSRYSRSFLNIDQSGSTMNFFQTFLESYVFTQLTSPDPYARFYSVLAAPYLKKMSPETIERVLNTWKKYPRTHIRAVAFGVLINILYRQRSKELAKWNRMVLEKFCKMKEFESRAYRLAAVWGYFENVKRDIDCDPVKMDELQWDEQQIYEYEMLSLKIFSKSESKRKMYLECLEKIMEIFEHIPERRAKEDAMMRYYLRILLFLYELDGRKEEAEKLAMRMCEKYGWKDAALFAAWGQLMQKNGKSQEALSRLEKVLPEIPSPGSAKILRTMAFLYQDMNEGNLARELFYRQYRVDPTDTQSLICVAEFHCDRGEYEQALSIFCHAQLRFRDNGQIHFGIARCHAARNDVKKATESLRNAYFNKYLFSRKQLEERKELKRLLDSNVLQRESWMKKI